MVAIRSHPGGDRADASDPSGIPTAHSGTTPVAGSAPSVLTRPEAELRRESNGLESWVFRAAHPGELLGIHAERVGRALKRGEKLHYLLYSPMWEGRGGPFGIRAEPASHAVAVTDSRFVISRDPHSDAALPTLQSIPFAEVLGIESGSALMLAWLVIHYLRDGSPHLVTVLYRALGRAHFATAVKAYRSLTASALGVAPHAALGWPTVWGEIGERYQEEVQPVLVDAESPLSSVAWPCLPARRRRSRAGLSCAAPEGALVLSTHGLLAVGHDPRALPRSPNFGVNALAVPYATLRAVTLVDRTTSGPFVLAVRIEIGHDATAETLEVPFPGERLPAVENALAPLAQRFAAAGIIWSS